MAIFYKNTNNLKENSRFGASVITHTNRPSHLDNIFKNYTRQFFSNKELIVILHNNSMNIELYKNKATSYDNVNIFQIDDSISLGNCKNFGVSKSKYKYISFFDDDDFYGPNYLKSSIEVLNRNNSKIVGKKSFFLYFEKEKILALYNPNYDNKWGKDIVLGKKRVVDSSMVIDREVFQVVKFANIMGPEVLFQCECLKRGFKISFADIYNYVVHRHDTPNKRHSWKISNEEILECCDIIETNIADYNQYVVK